MPVKSQMSKGQINVKAQMANEVQSPKGKTEAFISSVMRLYFVIARLARPAEAISWWRNGIAALRSQ
jgi:hypothetical protein